MFSKNRKIRVAADLPLQTDLNKNEYQVKDIINSNTTIKGVEQIE